jgi:hypothetical protein
MLKKDSTYFIKRCVQTNWQYRCRERKKRRSWVVKKKEKRKERGCGLQQASAKEGKIGRGIKEQKDWCTTDRAMERVCVGARRDGMQVQKNTYIP